MKNPGVVDEVELEEEVVLSWKQTAGRKRDAVAWSTGGAQKHGPELQNEEFIISHISFATCDSFLRSLYHVHFLSMLAMFEKTKQSSPLHSGFFFSADSFKSNCAAFGLFAWKEKENIFGSFVQIEQGSSNKAGTTVLLLWFLICQFTSLVLRPLHTKLSVN